MAQILTALVEDGAKLALEIRLDGIRLAQALLDRDEVEQLIATLEEQRERLPLPRSLP